MEEILKVSNVTKRYQIGKTQKYIHALDQVSIDVKPKEIYGIVGESGSGKSTLGKCILGLEHIDSGNVEFLGNKIDHLSIREMRQVWREMQMVFQNPFSSFNPKITIGKSLYRMCKLYHMTKTEAEERIEELLGLVNLGKELLRRLPNDLSGGQLQRFALVRALLNHPRFVIVDEGVSALDISVQAQVLNLLVDLRNKLGISIIFISHDLNVVQQICDRIAVLYLGQIVEVGSVEEVYNHTMHPYTQALILSKPKEHPDEQKSELKLKSEILHAVDVGKSCRFYGRCPYSEDGVCNQVEPELQEYAKDHWSTCLKTIKIGGNEI
ncbi:MAG: ABC transporter ATP-binding protein [Eubacteriales bacterium]|nr:ABC transporter ATP-binding protein [Eubacteriales bacterium]